MYNDNDLIEEEILNKSKTLEKREFLSKSFALDDKGITKEGNKCKGEKTYYHPYEFILEIPIIMERINWPMSKKLQEKWFSGKQNQRINYRKRDDYWTLGEGTHGRLNIEKIQLDWILSFSRAKIEYQKLIKPSVFLNDKFKEELQYMINRRFIRTNKNRVDFGNFEKPIDQLRGETIFIRKFKYQYHPDDLLGSLGKFYFNIIPKGIALKEEKNENDKIAKNIKVTISEIGVYVFDSFDFNDEWDEKQNRYEEQYLGDWRKKYPAGMRPNILRKISNDILERKEYYCEGDYVPIYNRDYRDYREKNKKGSDFLIFSNVVRNKLPAPIVIYYPY